MLTRKGKYGVKALVHLARLNPDEVASGAEIAEANTIPKKFLDAILSELRREGMVATRKGPGGGYSLRRDPASITLAEVVRVLDGPIAPLPCASRTAYRPCDDCASEAECTVRIAMIEVRNAMADILENLTLLDMVEGRSPARGRRPRAPRRRPAREAPARRRAAAR
ncbi:MAG TPA: Rrf2 family transcriptional regulator [Bauldia sp.]|nr:Rrf2 family transcriptional regulator [Bauldia sp.]